jgi:Nuclease-related domain
MAKQKLKSPIKDRPLRNPGESLDNQLNDLLLDEVLKYMMIAVMVIFLALMEWQKYFSNKPPSPWTITIIAFIVVFYCAIKIYRGFGKAKHLKQGRDGEKAVGQYLENLREQGAKVFHDIPGDNFNLDHVVICKSGIYVIETKTYSKPDKGETKALFNGETLLFNGKNETNQPVIQVKAASSWLKDLIEQSTGHKFMVKPVIVFPGWFIETTYEAKASDVWVLNPKGLPTFISNSKEQLSNEQVKLVAFNLSRYVRNFEEKE